MPEQRSQNFDHEPQQQTLSFDEMLSTWVTQEGDRYASLLIERGFLRSEDRENPECVREATTTWRKTYIANHDLAHRSWQQTSIRPQDVLQWQLGGWAGWRGYRPASSSVTTFADIAHAISQTQPGIPEHHRTAIPELASHISDVLPNGKIFALRCAGCVAVVEGSNRISALAYASSQHLSLPENFSVYICDLPDDDLPAFTQFCENIPIAYGEYYVAPPSSS